MNQPLQHVVIIGCGLLGTSLGLALRKHALAHTITGVGRHGSPSVATAQLVTSQTQIPPKITSRNALLNYYPRVTCSLAHIRSLASKRNTEHLACT